jgi:hypothetical protein
MPFENGKQIPKIHKRYEDVTGMQELSYNSVFHFANHYANCLSNAIIELMNPYLVTSLTGTPSSNLKPETIVLGSDNTIGGADLVFGSNNIIDTFNGNDPSFITKLYVLGNFNVVDAFCNDTIVFGGSNVVRNESSNNVIVGSKCIVGQISTNSTTFENNTTVGNTCSVQGTSCTAFGYGVTIYDGSFGCVAIGVESGIGGFSFTPPNNATAVGYQAYCDADNTVQLGQGYNATPSTLQFKQTTIANDVSIQATVQTTGQPPTSTPLDGTIVVDQSGNGKLWVRINGTWKSTTLT